MSEMTGHNGFVLKKIARGYAVKASLIIIFLIAIIAVFAPFIANDIPIAVRYNGSIFFPAIGYAPHGVSSDKLKTASSWAIYAPIQYSSTSYDLESVLSHPSSKHMLGTDAEGRDLAAQLVWGARVSVAVGTLAVIIALVIGIFVGLMAGYFGGWIDLAFSRIIEIVMCFPTFFLILTLLAFIGPSEYNIILVIGLVGWTGIARLVRGEVLKIRRLDFIYAARVSGSSSFRIMFRHILPHAIAPVLVAAVFGVAAAILTEAALSFLGFGVPPDVASWGAMLSDAQGYMDIAWWLTLVPGSAIFITIMSCNFIGEAIRDSIDPNMQI